MHGFFRKLPLAVKLLLIGVIPFLFIVYLSYGTYRQRVSTLNLLELYIGHVNESGSILKLIEELQAERRYTFIYSSTRSRPSDLDSQRVRTDSALNHLREIDAAAIKRFTSYTFLNELPQTRRIIDSIPFTSSDFAMLYYTNVIFRLNTLNLLPAESNPYIQPLYSDLEGQKILTQIITYLGIIRSDVYNILYSGRDVVGTLYDMRTTYNIKRSYQTEFIAKAPPEDVGAYLKLREDSTIKPVIEYVDRLFINFGLDSTYDAEEWWDASERWSIALYNLQQKIKENVNTKLNILYKKENAKKNETLFFLLLALILIPVIVFYTIHSITKMLKELRNSAVKIAAGAPAGEQVSYPNDVIGQLASSIYSIDETNRQLANSADAIGKGDFKTIVIPRSDEDILGLAIKRMKNNLQDFTQSLQKSEQKYRLLFEGNPMPLWMFSIKDLRIISVNEAAINHYGYSREEFQRMTINEIRPPGDEKRLVDSLSKPGSGVRHAGIWKHRKKNGDLIDVEIISHDIEFENEPVRLVLAIDVTEKLRSEEALKKSYEDIRELASHLENIREEERMHIAREIHDELGQQLTVMKMDISWLNKKLSNGEETINQKMKDLLQLVERTVKTVRKISSELRPSMLDDLGLVAALEWQSQEFEKRTGIKIDFISFIQDIEIDRKTATGFFRIYQESLTNVARHAEATIVESTLKLEKNNLILGISDNGRGFVDSSIANKKTLGILGMRERAEMMGGEFSMNTTPGRGTSINVKVPVDVK